jgi:hypothetical protein
MDRFPYIGWRPVNDNGRQEWVQMRSGAGEVGWWHRHADAPEDYGSNPVDGWNCRTCDKLRVPSDDDECTDHAGWTHRHHEPSQMDYTRCGRCGAPISEGDQHGTG